MLDGQGCLLPVRHFHSEDSPLMLSSWSGRYSTCRAEASAETSPSSNANPTCPCSPPSKVERESNHGELLDLNQSRPGHCSSILFVEANTTHTTGQEGAVLSISSQFDCSSTCPSRSVKGVEVDAPQPRSSNGEPEVLGVGHCLSSKSDSTLSEICRSGLEVGSFGKVSGGNESLLQFAEAASSKMTNEEEDLSRSEGDGRDGERGKRTSCFCKWEDVETSKSKVRSAGVECSSIPDEKLLGLACAGENFTKLKKTEECYSEPANGKKTLIKHSLSKRAAIGGGGFESQGANLCKKLRASNCETTSFRSLAAVCANKELACNSKDDNLNQQQPYLPGLDNESALRCLAFVPLSDLGRLSRVCRQYRDLVKSRLILKLRRTYGMVEHLVFIYTSGPGGWTAYDANRNVWMTLPPANVNPAFDLSDKESLSAGTHVLWLGKELFEFVYYRYDLLTNNWEKGPSMINPRCLFASASCGEFAFVAGGFGPADNTGALSLLNSAERYNSITGKWECLPPMSTPRHKCSGFFMDGKFYVIGGRDANHQPIMSGEEYNPNTGVWRIIPNMYFAPEIARRDMFEPSPPLVAVVNNQLYAVENTTNALKIYNKHNNTWSNLGYLPVPADLCNGWGVAFKALGDGLFVMGDLGGIAACCWRPGPTRTEPVWQLLSHRERGVDSFLYNCAVMTC